MLNIGDILDNRYEIQAKVGQGGMSHVYRARDLKMGRDVAIKVLKEEFSGRSSFLLVEYFLPGLTSPMSMAPATVMTFITEPGS